MKPDSRQYFLKVIFPNMWYTRERFVLSLKIGLQFSENPQNFHYVFVDFLVSRFSVTPKKKYTFMCARAFMGQPIGPRLCFIQPNSVEHKGILGLT